LTNLQSRSRKTGNILLSGLSEAVQGFYSLPCAKYEIETLQKLYDISDSSSLFNKKFTYPNMQNKISRTTYSMLHIASHGQFKPNLQDTFMLTYTGKVNMNRLEHLIRRTTLQDKPMELLTLSACETAVGNDRAALGLAGIALKAGVKSAMATLWKVDDAISPAIVIEFYRQLKNPKISKAQALQNAQIMILTDNQYTQYRHPYYWSAFMLIGNWF